MDMATTETNATTGTQVSENLNAVLANAGTGVQNGLNGVVLVHKARLTQQQRYAAALEKEYGSQDAGTKAAQAKVAATKLVIGKVTAAQQRAATPTIQLMADEWALHGRVYDANSQPIPQLTVFFVDNDKAWLRQYSFSYTDKTGYFVLKGTKSADGNASDTKASGIFIEIISDDRLPIYLDSETFAPVDGQAAYKTITLTSQTPIGDPPQAISETAFPPKG